MAWQAPPASGIVGKVYPLILVDMANPISFTAAAVVSGKQELKAGRVTQPHNNWQTINAQQHPSTDMNNINDNNP